MSEPGAVGIAVFMAKTYEYRKMDGWQSIHVRVYNVMGKRVDNVHVRWAAFEHNSRRRQILRWKIKYFIRANEPDGKHISVSIVYPAICGEIMIMNDVGRRPTRTHAGDSKTS